MPFKDKYKGIKITNEIIASEYFHVHSIHAKNNELTGLDKQRGHISQIKGSIYDYYVQHGTVKGMEGLRLRQLKISLDLLLSRF